MLEGIHGFAFRSPDCERHDLCSHVCVYNAADSNPKVVKHELCVSVVMRAVADTSMRQCIFLLMSIAQHVLALHVFKSLCG